jgi:hypothetical protein
MGNTVFLSVIGIAFVFCFGEIVNRLAKNRGRNTWVWVTVGCALTVLGGVAGFLAAPAVVEGLDLAGEPAARAVFLSIWISAVIVAAILGTLLRLLGPVAKRDVTFGAAPSVIQAQDRILEEQCNECGFLFELGDRVCQCGVCAGYYHLRCWNSGNGCSVCRANA